MKYSAVESTDGKSWSLKVKDSEKPGQSARLMSHVGGLDTAVDGAVMCKFTRESVQTYKSKETCKSKWTAIRGLPKVRPRAD
jgi:hypothetical protein